MVKMLESTLSSLSYIMISLRCSLLSKQTVDQKPAQEDPRSVNELLAFIGDIPSSLQKNQSKDIVKAKKIFKRYI